MKYKVGDKVIVRRDLRTGMIYEGWSVVNSMKKFFGKLVTIKTVDEHRGGYYLEEDEMEFWWSDEMFEGIKITKHEVDAKTQKEYLKNSDLFLNIISETEE